MTRHWNGWCCWMFGIEYLPALTWPDGGIVTRGWIFNLGPIGWTIGNVDPGGNRPVEYVEDDQ